MGNCAAPCSSKYSHKNVGTLPQPKKAASFNRDKIPALDISRIPISATSQEFSVIVSQNSSFASTTDSIMNSLVSSDADVDITETSVSEQEISSADEAMKIFEKCSEQKSESSDELEQSALSKNLLMLPRRDAVQQSPRYINNNMLLNLKKDENKSFETPEKQKEKENNNPQKEKKNVLRDILAGWSGSNLNGTANNLNINNNSFGSKENAKQSDPLLSSKNKIIVKELSKKQDFEAHLMQSLKNRKNNNNNNNTNNNNETNIKVFATKKPPTKRPPPRGYDSDLEDELIRLNYCEPRWEESEYIPTPREE